MSSSAALASAKKRRVEQSQNNNMFNRRLQQRNRVSQPQNNNNAQNSSNVQNSNVQNNEQTKKLTPLQALTSHDKRLDRIESEFPQAVGQINDNISILSENMNEFKKLSEKVNVLEKTVDKENSKENLNFFKDKVNNMEKQLTDIKALFLKIQSFAMETNLTLMKYKNGMDAKLAKDVQNKHTNDNQNGIDKNKNTQLNVDNKTVLS